MGDYTSSSEGTTRMADRSLELLQGTLDLLILKTLSWGPAHGYAIVRWIQQLSSEQLIVSEGSLYPALHRLEERSLVKAEWRLSESKRKARFYSLTAAGRRQLQTEEDAWSRFVGAVRQILKATAQPV